MASNLPKIILITGDPGVGKTTLMRKLYDRISQDQSKQIKGFYTEELRDASHTRIGFDVIDLRDNQRAPLARLNPSQNTNCPRVGKYFVDLNNFEKVAIPIIRDVNAKNIYLIDEVGKMESFSKDFERSILNMLYKISTENFLLVATVPSKNLTLSDKIKSHPMSKLFQVTFQNRDKIIDEIFTLVNESYAKL